MNKAVVGSVVILAYVNLVPYVCRIWRGIEWVSQYLPDEGHRISGLIFFASFGSLPAIPLVSAFLLRKWIPVTLVVSIIVATALLVFWHHDYDLRSDAQAAIGLIFIPVYATLITAAVAGTIAVIEFMIRRNRKFTNNDGHTKQF
jgi:hypothetical protein